jgi:hypothetical protein
MFYNIARVWLRKDFQYPLPQGVFVFALLHYKLAPFVIYICDHNVQKKVKLELET